MECGVLDPATHLFEHRARPPLTVEFKVPGRCRESNDGAMHLAVSRVRLLCVLCKEGELPVGCVSLSRHLQAAGKRKNPPREGNSFEML